MSKFLIIKKRKDFLRAAKDITMMSHHVMLQAARPLSNEDERRARIGFTATKRLGKANYRNRTKRRLRAVVREIYDDLALNNVDYVLVGRFDTATCPFAELRRDVIYTFKKANKEILQTNLLTEEENVKEDSDSTD